MVCRQCQGIEQFFDPRRARRELERYRTLGPRKLTQVLIDAIKEEGVEGQTVLDIGGGIGAIQHELLKAGAANSIGVEASTAYIMAAEQEAQAQGHAWRMNHAYGNFVEIAGDIQPADIVTLDRVICCYPDLERLLDLSSQRATRIFGVIFPVDNWALRGLARLFNTYLWLRRQPFRFFVHRSSAVDGLLRSSGFHRRFYRKSRLWQAAVYRR
ncbi:MAG: methyltransferase domain-containing protein [Dehalococcoidia bacterium]|nr:methyltransferase domain-containing protein [Dehalococcoidia bacterium]MDP6228533.1 methyltransferase domain-containing protein [Dehalococcoidia bacterium]MDP7085415.1 methyltransferase domain-containing protein [Dehalococcoidia bacterium]MDP7202184.1 methyltransferase domain-containing protein [Dehalococcoidia bacterium]MDP7510225.1 methyltransferase domain-containing protein [Dehalococcoidia bacterium]